MVRGIITVLFPYLSAKGSRRTFIDTNFPARQFLVHSPKYFSTWAKIITKFILNLIWAKINTFGKFFLLFR